MQAFDYYIYYIKGEQNKVADALSRQHQEVHQTSASVLKQLMAFTLVKVDENILKSLEREYRKDPDFKIAFQTPIAPFSRNKTASTLRIGFVLPKERSEKSCYTIITNLSLVHIEDSKRPYNMSGDISIGLV